MKTDLLRILQHSLGLDQYGYVENWYRLATCLNNRQAP